MSLDRAYNQGQEYPEAQMAGRCTVTGGVWRGILDGGANDRTRSTESTYDPDSAAPDFSSKSPQSAPPSSDPDDGQPKASDIQNAPRRLPRGAADAGRQPDQARRWQTDVDAVGNRNVGCGRGVGNWYSVEKQVAMGRSSPKQVESQVKLVNDPVVTNTSTASGRIWCVTPTRRFRSPSR